MKMICGNCKNTYYFDDAKIPAEGIQFKCPRCGNVLVFRKGAQDSLSFEDSQYAGFWVRLAASLFDSAALLFVELGIGITLVALKAPAPRFVMGIFQLLVFWLYNSLMESSNKQATIGEMVLGIEVTDTEGNKISFLRATGRTFAIYLSVITLGIGFLMVAFTKRKQALHDMVAGTLAVKRGESHFGRAVLVSVISFFVIIALAGAYGYFVLWPRITKSFSTAMTAMTEPNKISNIGPQNEQIVPYPEEITPFSEQQYDALLSKPLAGLEGTNVGPAVLKISNFWNDKLFGPHIWIKANLPMLPNFANNRLARIIINNVQNKNGQDVYYRGSSFEKPFFQSFSLSEIDFPIQHLHGIRDVRLIPGTNEDDIVSINGKLVLPLPIDIKELSFNTQDIGKTKEIAGVSIGINAIGKSQVLWTYQGSGRNFFDIRAYNANGQQLESGFFRSSPSEDKDYSTPEELKSLFKGDIASVKIFIVTEMKEREYPFTLRK